MMQRCASAAALLLAALALSPAMASADAGSDVPATLRSALQERYPLVTRWEIERAPERRRRDTAVMAGSDSVQVLQLGARSAVRQWNRIDWYVVRGYQQGLVMTRFVDARQSLTPADIVASDVDAVGAGCEPLRSMPEQGAWRARARLSGGTALCAGDIEPLPMVTRGSVVTVRISAATLEIKTRARALSDGHIGDRLSVRSIASGELIEGVVTGTAEVSIDATS